jgi:hypothetical protein
MLRFTTSFMGAGKAEIPGHFSRPRPISPDTRMSRKPRSTPSCITKRRDAEKTESRRPSARRRSGRSRGSPRRGSRVCGGYGRARAGRALRSALNPGHLARHDEWIHTPIRPGSGQRIAPGMPFQVDIIPTPMRDGWALNCQDRIVFAATALSAELKGPPSRRGRTDRSAPKLRSRQARNRNQGFDPAAFIDAVVPAALLAFGPTVAGAGMTAVDNKGPRKAVA